MTSTFRHLTVPSINLEEKESWMKVSENTYAALRMFVVIRESRDSESRLGVPIEEYTIEPNSEVSISWSEERLVSAEESISDGIKFSVSSKLCSSFMTKTSAVLGSKSPLVEAKIGQELHATVIQELRDSIEQNATSTLSYKIEKTDKRTVLTTLKGKNKTQKAKVRRRYWAHHWDIFVHSWDYLELTYEMGWTLNRIRKESKKVPLQELGWPVCRLTFYVPQTTPDVSVYPVPDVLQDPDSIIYSAIESSMPSLRLPKSPPLSQSAAIAFPGNRKERSAAKKAASARRPAAKKVAKKAAAKKAPARKAATKKAAAKKAPAKRVAAKKAARKSSQ